MRIVLKKLGWKEVDDEDDWQLYWTDTSVSLERVMMMKKTQKMNHFCGMLEICRKKKLANNFARMAKVAEIEYTFHPITYTLPDDLDDFLDVVKSKKKKTYILKPDAGCQVSVLKIVLCSLLNVRVAESMFCITRAKASVLLKTQRTCTKCWRSWVQPPTLWPRNI